MQKVISYTYKLKNPRVETNLIFITAYTIIIKSVLLA